MRSSLRISSSISAMTIGFLAISAPVSAQSAQDPEQEAASVEGDVIVVTGIRAALNSAINQKREAANIVEVINAEDIGKLPDDNVAEVLENLPGVQIDRVGGVGTNVSIRGSDQNRVEINGRGTTPAGDERGGISLSDLPAELISSLEVVKVPTADMVEGSLGGTIDVKTYNALDLTKPITSARAQIEYGERSDSWNKSFSGTLARTFDTPIGEMGFVLTAITSDQEVREDSLRVSPFLVLQQNSTIDIDGDGSNDGYIRPAFGDVKYGLQDLKTTSFTGSVGWQATPELRITAEGLYSKNRNAELQQSTFVGSPQSDVILDATDITFTEIDAGGVKVPIVVTGTYGGGCFNGRADLPGDAASPGCVADGLQMRTNNQSQQRKTDTYLGALNAEWEGDGILLEADVSFAGSDTEAPGLFLVYQLQNPNAANPFVDTARQRIPFYYDNTGDVLEFGPTPNVFGETVDEAFLYDPSNYVLFIARDSETFFKNREYTQSFDATFDTDFGPIVAIKTGVRLSQSSNARDRQSQATRQFPGVTANDFDGFNLATPGDFFAFNPGGNYLDAFITADPAKVQANREEIRRIAGLAVGSIDDPAQSFQVDEKTYAGYVRADYELPLGDMFLRGNFGVRVVHTDQTAEGDEVLPDNSTRPIVAEQKYTTFLPSFNLVFEPTTDVQVRAGYARILRRPDFGDLSPTVAFPLNNAPVTVGNPQLQPTKADQFDLSATWYPMSGTMLSAGVFYKDIKSTIGSELVLADICNPRGTNPDPTAPNAAPPCNTAGGEQGILVGRISPLNLPGGNIKGLELAAQHIFDYLPSPLDGFGIIGNFTYQKGKRDLTFMLPDLLNTGGVQPEYPLNFVGLSKTSYNLTVFYEKAGFNARVRYTKRSSYLVSELIDISSGYPLYRTARPQLNASLGYDVNEWLSVQASATNLLEDPIIERAVFDEGFTARVLAPERRFQVGVAVKF